MSCNRGDYCRRLLLRRRFVDLERWSRRLQTRAAANCARPARIQLNSSKSMISNADRFETSNNTLLSPLSIIPMFCNYCKFYPKGKYNSAIFLHLLVDIHRSFECHLYLLSPRSRKMPELHCCNCKSDNSPTL